MAPRLAVVEQYVKTGEPLPIISDDIFESFDERRTAAGSDLLVERGEHTQTIVFRHHERLAEIAMEHQSGRVIVHSLAAPILLPAV